MKINMAEKNKDEKKGFSFRYIDKPNKVLQKWDSANRNFREIGEIGEIEYFLGFLCPICIAEMNVEERVRGEYSTIEKLILKLYHNGIIQAELLSDLTGLNIEMVKNILDVLENSYGHIKDGVLTEDGVNSLECDINIQRYETSRQIQIEGLTGCVLIPELSQTMPGDNPYYDKGQPASILKYPPSDSVIVNLKQDFADILNEYQDYESGIFDRNIEMINSIEIEGNINVECFLVKYTFLPHPFLILPSQAARYVRWIPVAISASNKEAMEEHGIGFHKDVPVCSDSRIVKLIDIYESNLRLDEERLENAPEYEEVIIEEEIEAVEDEENDEKDPEKRMPVVLPHCRGKVEYRDKN